MRKISYRDWWPAYLVFASLLMLQSCQGMGYGDIEIDTARKQILVSTAEVRGANMLLQDLIKRNAISQSDAQRAKNSLQTATNGLYVALNAVEISGDPQTASRQLDAVHSAIQIALAILGPLVEDNP